MVAPSPSEIPVSEADLDVLRDRTGRLDSGYHNVYRKGRRRDKNAWQARPYSSAGDYDPTQPGARGRKGRNGPRVLIGTFRSPREAARAVVRWWKLRAMLLGTDDWAAVYRARCRNPWWTRQEPGGWRLVVRVGDGTRDLPAPGTVLFSSHEAAAAYYRQWWANQERGGRVWNELKARRTAARG